tara:strand:+ start:755 stop:922 length:168 start_codon:yes stop_codon:yes gene_type:complete
MSWETIVKGTLDTIVIEESESYKSLAKKVAEVLIKDYGEHNYKPFMQELKKLLGE